MLAVLPAVGVVAQSLEKFQGREFLGMGLGFLY